MRAHTGKRHQVVKNAKGTEIRFSVPFFLREKHRDYAMFYSCAATQKCSFVSVASPSTVVGAPGTGGGNVRAASDPVEIRAWSSASRPVETPHAAEKFCDC